MNKSLLAAFAFASILSACSSHPSDFRPSNKVSVDQVPPGTRETDIYNLQGGEDTEHGSHDHAASHPEPASHEAPADTAHNAGAVNHEVNHDAPESVNGHAPAAEKAADAQHEEGHK